MAKEKGRKRKLDDKRTVQYKRIKWGLREGKKIQDVDKKKIQQN